MSAKPSSVRMLLIAFVFTSFGFAISAGHRTAEMQTAPKPPEPKFVPIFNGKDLSGWKIPRETTGTGRSSMA